MDQHDRDILNIIQSGFPLAARPYAKVGRQVGLSEEEVIQRVRDLKDRGIIRRIGGNVWAPKVGYVSTLCGAKVPEEKLDLFAETVNSFPGVTHNYCRDNEILNVWFTLIVPSQEDLEATLTAIQEKTGILPQSFPALKTYKIKVDFEV